MQDDVMVFTEVTVKGDATGADRIARILVLWMRRRARRIQALSQLRLDGFCDREEVFECKIFYNNVLWPEADFAIRQFLDGDAIWVEIQMNRGSARQAFAMLEEVENHARSLQLYYNRPVQQPDEEPESGSDKSASDQECRSRSRSRQRRYRGEGSEAPGSVEDAPWDLGLHPQVHAEALSLLQLAVINSHGEGHHSSFDMLPPPGNTVGVDSNCTVDENDEISDSRIATEHFIISDGEEDEHQQESVVCRMTTDVDTKQIWKMFQPWHQTALQLDIDIDDNFTALSLQFLSGCGVGWDDTIEEVHLFTDGSHSKRFGVASYAVTIFGWSGREKLKHHFLGWFGGVVTTDESSENFVGAKNHTAGDGEISAIIWALMWIMQSKYWKTMHLHFDSLAAGYTAKGEWRCDTDHLHKRKLRELAQAAEAIRPGMLQFHHVKAHSGQPCNELADGFAKQALQRGDRNHNKFPSWRPLFQEGDLTLTWTWWFLSGLQEGREMIVTTGSEYRWNKPMRCGLEGITPLETKEISHQETNTYQIRIATYNVMTLRDKETEQGQRGEDWKAALLRRQFSQQGLHIVGLQETRASSSGVITTPDYIRFISEGKDGHHGCELWIHKSLRIGVQEGHPLCLNPATCTILHADHRLLIATITVDGLRLVLHVLHAPHDGTEESQRAEWWEQTRHLTQRYMNLGTSIFIGDMNSRFGEPIPGRIGSRLCNCTTRNAQDFIELLEIVDGWLPSTFSAYHSGQDWTWTHPRGEGRTARLDYIALEKAPCLHPKESWVECDLQSSLTVRDHELVVMDVEIACGQGKKQRRRPAYDWDGLITKEGKEIPDQPWDTDIHVHWQRLEDGIHQGLLKYFPAKKKEKSHTVFSPQTLETLQSRKQAKRILDQVDEELRGLTLQAGFETWRDPIPLTMAMDVQRLRRMALVLCHCFGLRRFREAATCVRKAIKEDKANYISATVERAQQAHGVDIFKELAPLRIGGKFRKRGATTLPGFSFNGEQARDHLHNEDLWLRYCATFKAGVATSTSRLVQRARRGSMDRLARLDSPFKLEDAPSLVHLEGAFRHVAKGKAGGADGFLSNVCYAAPKELAQKFFPVMLKMMATLEEPIQAKGGVLVAAFKGGVASNPEDHRSLLLSSHLGKSVRRAIRQQLIGPYSTTTPDTFFSIRQGGSVSHASQALRLYAGAKAHRGESTGILFLDVKAAYYRIIRQLAVRGREQHSIERVMEHFDLGATDLQELLSEIHNIPDYDGSNFTKHQELMLEELLSSTWFTAQHRSRLYESLAGSRPGDGLADLVFGIVFKRILQRVTERLKDILHIEDTEINGDVSLIESGGEIREAPQLLQAVWADDLAVCFSRKGAHQLVEDMAKVTSVVFQECLRHGLIPNLKKGKSEILLLLRGEGSRSAKAIHLNGQEPRLWIPEVPEDFQWVNLVHTYKHLGTRVHISLKLMSEIKARCGQAGSTYRKHRRQIFQNPRLSRDKRVYLFGSMVMSILEFNVGTWGKLNKSEWAYCKKRVTGPYRGLARAEIPEEDLRLWSHDKILAFLRVPSPEVLLHVSRLRYMISLWNSAPATLLHLIGAEQSWLGELQESQHWMEEQLRGYGPDSNGHPWTPDWSGWRCGGGQAMKSWIKKAKQIAILRHTRRVEWREFHFEYLNECRQAGWMHEFPWPDGQEFVDEQQLEACMACGLVFKNRAAWSVHAFRAHARRNPRRRVIGGTRCDACGREYRSTARLLNHLRNSDSCYRQLLHAGKVYEDILPGIGSRNEIRGGPMPVPVMRSQGPREEALTENFQMVNSRKRDMTSRSWTTSLTAFWLCPATPHCRKD